MRIALASDHGGCQLKESIVKHLQEKNVEVVDFGVKDATIGVDYPDYAAKVADAVVKEEADAGILVCGTGIGMSIAANKVKGIRAAVLSDVFSAKATKEHNNANIICLGQRTIGEGLALMLVDTWLESEYLGERHQTRIEKIHHLEEIDKA